MLNSVLIPVLLGGALALRVSSTPVNQTWYEEEGVVAQAAVTAATEFTAVTAVTRRRASLHPSHPLHPLQEEGVVAQAGR